jgi:hypothetical protein
MAQSPSKKPRPVESHQAGQAVEKMGLGRVELPTSRLSGVRSNHLSYRPLRRDGEYPPAVHPTR